MDTSNLATRFASGELLIGAGRQYHLQCYKHAHNNSHFVCRCPVGTRLNGSSQTGHWGYWYDLLEPALVIGNDTEIEVEMPTFAAGQACKPLLYTFALKLIRLCCLLSCTSRQGSLKQPRVSMPICPANRASAFKGCVS